MKKKILLVVSAIIILAAIAVGSTLAWFTDTDSATNVFTVGNIDIVQNEEFDDTAAMLIPVVGNDPTAASDNYIEKRVTVENEGRNAAFVQTFVAVPAVLDNNSILKLYDVNASANGWTKIDGDANTDGIQPVATGISIDGETIPYNVYLYRYNTALAKNTETAPCLEYVYIDSAVDVNLYDVVDNDGVKDTGYFVLEDGTEITAFNSMGELNVYVATQAVQSDGFDTAKEAFAAAFEDKIPEFTA